MLYFLHRWHLSLLIDRDIFHSCYSSTVSKRLECCELRLASHLIDVLLDDRIHSLRGVRDDLGLQPIEIIQPENEKLIAELANSFGWRDEWLQDEELCQKQTEMHAMMTSFAKTQSETLFELMKQNPSIASVPVAYPNGSADGEGGPKARQWE